MANDSLSFSYQEALQRARRGAAVLDEKEPGWREKVDPASLDLRCAGDCVLGQLHPGLSPVTVVRDLGLGEAFEPDSIAHGFFVLIPASTSQHGEYLAAVERLTDAWREVLAS